ncbi:MAG TPA: DNA topoisomerase IB [Verrucomicrobiae bacterium]|nr:DNA topoisomerase IB [Verrucomicrobiae bacterium]
MESARAVGLRYVHDHHPGIHREKNGRGFRYVDAAGKSIRDRSTLQRIESLVIPPAWNDVWICPSENGHLQASGRDERNRKQHVYHQRWREVRDETKFHRLVDFARVLPAIRRRLTKDLARQGLCREKVLATVVRLLETSLIRVGNEGSARENHTYGLTTMENRHATVSGGTIHFHFRGKSNKEHAIAVHDPRVAKIVRACQHLPGHELFHYVNEAGEKHHVGSHDVNEYLREISGEEFTAKEFRTWGGTLSALTELRKMGPAEKVTQCRKNIVSAIKTASQHLGNTPTVCRKSYIHPVIIEAYLEGSLIPTAERLISKMKSTHAIHLRLDELVLLEFLTLAGK